ncbi:MAG: HAMP domain-containing protein [Calditrichaeota bacterium]|nr:HAMP domain-containing protein [Calditrichota bacterium]
MKIGYRFAGLYFGVTLVILLIFSLSVYWGMQRILLTTLDENLHFVVNSIENNYDPSKREFEYMEAEPEKADPFLEYYLVIYNLSGKPIYKSAIAQKVHLAIPLSRENSTEGFTTRITVKEAVQWVHPDRGGEITFRAFNRKIYYKNHQIGWVTIARPIEEVDESLNKLALVFSIAILGTVLLIGLGSYFITRRVLSPITLITRKANQISHTNLNERIEGVQSNDELGALANTLNGLLDRLQKAFESQQRFLADAAHELKTPLAVLRAHWEEELNNAGLQADLREKLAHDVELLSRLNHLINSLLLLSKTENVSAEFSFEPVNLADLLNEVVSDASVLAAAKKQTLEIGRLDSQVILGDRDRLYQMVFNIVENAVKYTPEGGQIKIEAQQKNGRVEISVTDNGPGIPAEDVPHLFDRFYRVKKDRSRETGGSGLGLAISQLIARIHGGTITVTSEVGKGSRFEITLKAEENA